MEKLRITKKTPEEIISLNKPGIFNFFNMNSVFFYFKNKKYQSMLLEKQNIIFPDGRIVALKLRIRQQKGPAFTKRFLLSENARNKKHFFIGLNNEDIKKILKITKINSKNIGFYNPPFIRGIEFSEGEKKKILNNVKNFRPDFVWCSVGGPKQDILSNYLFKNYKSFYFNVGAGIDFFIGKKRKSPRFFTNIGMEWLYRLLTDFKTTKKKAWRSFVALKHLKEVMVR